MPSGDYTGLWCPQCDQRGQPAILLKQMAARAEGMLLRCSGCGVVKPYAAWMALHPRMDKPSVVEKQPPGAIVHPLWIHPEVLAALQQKFPSNLQTTLCSVMQSLADPDSVLVEGPYARELRGLGMRTGREVLGLAREVISLRKQVAEMKVREDALAPLFAAMGGAFGRPAGENGQPAGQPPAVPPHAEFAHLAESPDGLLVPDGADAGQPAPAFSFPAGPAPTAATAPAWVVPTPGGQFGGRR
jgi:hypothetical protein